MSTAPAVDEYKAQPIPWVSDADWHARTSKEREKYLNSVEHPDLDPGLDPVWRIANLYTIRDKDTGQFRQFVPKPEQRVLIWDVYVRGYRNIIDLKARRLGISTLLMIMALDRVLFMAGQKAMLIDKTAEDAKTKMTDMVQVAWNKMDPAIKKAFLVKAQTEIFTSQLNTKGLKIKGPADENISTLRVHGPASGRGGEAHFLIVSEWGTIQFKFPEMSSEIKTGAMIAAEHGIRIIETTWKGGKGGDLWGYIKLALETKHELKGPKGWHLRFFPWYLEKDYATEGDYNSITGTLHQYFDRMEQECKTTFSAQQRMWYYLKVCEHGKMVKREFPTVLRECWEAPVEGAIYGEEVEKARTANRIFDFPINRSIPVDTFADLGAPANTTIIYVQHVAGERHIIDCDAGLDMTLGQRVIHMKGKGYTFGTHFIPHDGGALQKGGISYQKEFMEALNNAGMTSKVVVVPRTPNVWIGVNKVLELFPSFIFHATNTKRLVECLEAYRRKPDPLRDGGFLDEIVHDFSSHSADALRNLAEAKLASFIPNHSESIMTNAYFDPAIITRLSSEAVGRHSSIQLFTITKPQHAKQAIPLRDNEHGWLRVWERERLNSSYIITLTGRALSVWRGHEQDQHGAPIKAALVAAGTADLRILPSQLITWAAELSEVYGGCMVVPDVDTLPSSVEALTALGVPLYSRKVPRHDQRVGQGQPIAKPGWDMTEEKYRQAMVELQAMLTADALAIHCTTTLDQLTAVIRDAEGNPVTQEGYQCDWAEAAAMAALTLPLATLWQARPAPVGFNPNHAPEGSTPTRNQFDQWGGQLAIGG